MTPVAGGFPASFYQRHVSKVYRAHGPHISRSQTFRDLKIIPLRTSSKIATQLKEKPLKVFSGICARASDRRLVHAGPADACMKSFKGLRDPSS